MHRAVHLLLFDHHAAKHVVKDARIGHLFTELGSDLGPVGVGTAKHFRKTASGGQTTCVSVPSTLNHACLSQFTHVIVGTLTKHVHQA